MVLGEQVEKFIITLEDNSEIQAVYNPGTFKMSYGTQWKDPAQRDNNVGEAEFVSTNATKLDVTLLFDTYHDTFDSVTSKGIKNQGKQIQNVDVGKRYINDMVRLVRIDGRYHRPPICTLKWGKMSWGSKLPFKCVLTSLTIDYKMFLADGTPVRAEAVCSFQQWRDAKEDQQSVDKKSPDVFKVHVVKRGETLSSIAYQHFNSPSYWRFIATANKITNPHRLEPGRVLTIPALKPEER